MEEIPESEVNVKVSDSFYLPHHAVMKAERAKCEPESFLCAFACSTEPGGFVADVEKMYRQVWIHPLDRNYLRIVWHLRNSSGPIKHYRLCTVTYGTRPAPYLAIEAMRQAAKEYNLVYPEAAERIVHVDNFLSGPTSIDDAKRLKNQVCEILTSAGFNLRKWIINQPELMNDDERTEQGSVEMKSTEQSDAVKAFKGYPPKTCFLSRSAYQ